MTLYLTLSTFEGELFEIKISQVSGAASTDTFDIYEWCRGKFNKELGWYYSGQFWMTDYGWRMDGKFLGWMQIIEEYIKTPT